MKVPLVREEIIALAIRALGGAQVLGVLLGLLRHTAAGISTDLYDLIGEPAPGTNAGKQAALNAARAAVVAVRATRRNAIAAGRKFCADAIDNLKPHLGRSWSPSWVAAGFSTGSLALPRNPLPMLVELRAYFQAHADHEDIADGVTAAQADARVSAIQSAVQALDAAKSNRADAADARDSALT